MTQPRHAFLPILDHEIHLTEWGDPAAPAIVMWHGLARTGRDFDELAAALSDRFFVLCPDTIGRGLSSWSRNPEAEYSVDYYAGIAADLLDHYRLGRVGWLGTSMGGLIGMRLASGSLADRLAWLIVNDIGPEIPEAAIARILDYADSGPRFSGFADAETWLRAAYAPFGPAPDAFWRRMARTSLRRRTDGALALHYDPAITVQFTASPDELNSWDRFARISRPMHVLRGANSDILLPEIAARMQRLGPRPDVTTYADCGHAPSLSRPDDHSRIRAIIEDLTEG